MPVFQVQQWFALNVIFQLHLVTAAASDPYGSTERKDFSVQTCTKWAFNVIILFSKVIIFQQFVVYEGFGRKGAYRELSLAVILMSENLNFAYMCGYEGLTE